MCDGVEHTWNKVRKGEAAACDGVAGRGGMWGGGGSFRGGMKCQGWRRRVGRYSGGGGGGG